MITILHIVGDSMSRAGMETFIMNIYRNIDLKRYQFHFLVHSDKKGDFDDEIESMGGKIFIVKPALKDFYFKRVGKRFHDTYKFLKNYKKYNAIHIHTSAATSLVELFAAYLSGCSIRIVHSHNTYAEKSRTHKMLRIFMACFSTHRYACSEQAGIWMFGKGFLKLKNAKIFYNGIDTEVFYFDINRQQRIKSALNVGNKLVIGHIGRFSKVKNHEFIVEIFVQVLKKNRHSVLFLIGDGELRPEIAKKVQEMQIDNNVIFMGVRSDINDLLLALDIMLFPSIYEGLPVALVEAQATGLKILASDAVSREADISGLIKHFSLSQSADEWANILLEEAYYEREDQTDSIKKAKYDIGGSVSELCKSYDFK